jgi:hypothetical protein
MLAADAADGAGVAGATVDEPLGPHAAAATATKREMAPKATSLVGLPATLEPPSPMVVDARMIGQLCYAAKADRVSRS